MDAGIDKTQYLIISSYELNLIKKNPKAFISKGFGFLLLVSDI